MKWIKTIITASILFAIYLIPSIFAPFDVSWYENLNKPSITPPNYVFGIVWTIMYLLLSISAALTFKEADKNHSLKNYSVILFLNYIFIQLYSYLQFSLKSLELAFIDIILVFITSLLLYNKTKQINKRAAYLLIPLIIWVIFALFLQVGFLRLN